MITYGEKDGMSYPQSQGKLQSFGSMASPNPALTSDAGLETFRARSDSSQSGDSTRAHA